jgi:thiamine-phosphate pyrophosphorylase
VKDLTDCYLYAFVDTAYLHGREAADLARQLCEGGADLIQLRAKSSTPDEIRHMAESILPITHSAGVGLVINDHFSLAQELGAEFCHLGQEDFFDAGHTHVSELRYPKSAFRIPTSLPPSAFPIPDSPLRAHHSALGLGLSTHSPKQAYRAVFAGADYVAVGPVYATGTKPSAKPVTLEYVQWAAANLQFPWFAIGGINPTNIDDVLAAGARRVCVVSAILNAQDVRATCRQFKKRLVERAM